MRNPAIGRSRLVVLITETNWSFSPLMPDWANWLINTWPGTADTSMATSLDTASASGETPSYWTRNAFSPKAGSFRSNSDRLSATGNVPSRVSTPLGCCSISVTVPSAWPGPMTAVKCTEVPKVVAAVEAVRVTTLLGCTTRRICLVAVTPLASVIWTVAGKVPTVVGRPEIRPVAGSRVSPGGRMPSAIPQVNGAVPPTTVSRSE